MIMARMSVLATAYAESAVAVSMTVIMVEVGHFVTRIGRAAIAELAACIVRRARRKVQRLPANGLGEIGEQQGDGKDCSNGSHGEKHA
jgi:hypothetical protein